MGAMPPIRKHSAGSIRPSRFSSSVDTTKQPGLFAGTFAEIPRFPSISRTARRTPMRARHETKMCASVSAESMRAHRFEPTMRSSRITSKRVKSTVTDGTAPSARVALSFTALVVIKFTCSLSGEACERERRGRRVRAGRKVEGCAGP